MSELKLKLSKRKKKRNRLKRLKSELKIIKSQQKDETREINRKIEAWQNTFKENILNEKRVAFLQYLIVYYCIVHNIFILGKEN